MIPAIVEAVLPELIELVREMVAQGHDPKKEIPRLRLSYTWREKEDEDKRKAFENRFGKLDEPPETD
jgi:hypothetical protein